MYSVVGRVHRCGGVVNGVNTRALAITAHVVESGNSGAAAATKVEPVTKPSVTKSPLTKVSVTKVTKPS
jgi:hypothetical protein